VLNFNTNLLKDGLRRFVDTASASSGTTTARSVIYGGRQQAGTPPM
jgi:hypothetical protein